MKNITLKDIRALNPCYDPSKYLPEDWQGTVIDILDMDEVPAEDRVWVALRLIDRFLIEVFAIDCAFRSNTAHADAAAAAAYAAYAAAHTDADAATYAHAVDAAYAAASYAYAAATYAASASAADAAAERQNQIDVLIYLLENPE